MDAMMYVIISENLHDKTFSTHILSVLMKTLCQKAYQPTIVGCLPFWRKRWDTQNAGMAEKITHVPAQSIRQLARDYALQNPQR